ncbi:MAG: alkaline phosphatase family protein [Rhodospirillales bacterium]
MSRPRKVLFLAGDQWRADALGCMGHPLVKTPRLDRLAAEGTLFRNHFTQASPCGPARSCLLTGTYLMTNRAVRNGTPLDRRFTNLALEARKAGLTPYLYGYTDTAADPRGRPPRDPELQGYEGVLPGLEVGCRIDEDLRPWRAHLQAKGYGPLPEHHVDLFEPPDGSLGGPAFFEAEDSLTAFLTDRAIDCLRANHDRDWLIYLSLWHPHPPLRAPAPWHAAYDPADMAPAATGQGAGLHPFHRYCLGQEQGLPYYLGNAAAGRALDPEITAQLKATYYGLIGEADNHIGRLLDVLEETGQAEDTLVISTVDHGEMLGDQGLLGKQTFFDPAFHIPLIVRDPRQPTAGRAVSAFTEAVDLMPTVLDWLGQSLPGQCDGRSLKPLLTGAVPGDWREAVFWEHDFRDPVTRKAEAVLNLDSEACNLAVLRDSRFKYVHFAKLPPLLFDIQADPHETRNLAEEPAFQAQRLAMAEAMLRLRQRHAEQTLTNLMVGANGVGGDLAAAGLGGQA